MSKTIPTSVLLTPETAANLRLECLKLAVDTANTEFLFAWEEAKATNKPRDNRLSRTIRHSRKYFAFVESLQKEEAEEETPAEASTPAA